MTTDEDIRAALFAAIRKVAPEAEPGALRPGANLRDELDLDSMDFLNVVTNLHAALSIDVPEADYAKLATVESAVAYLAGRLRR